MEELCQFIAKQLDLAVEDIKPETNIRELADDSLEMVELIIALEDRYEVDIPDEEIDRLLTLQDIHGYLSHISGQAGIVESEHREG